MCSATVLLFVGIYTFDDFSNTGRNTYEAERKAKQERRRELTEQLATSRENEQSVDAWLDMVQDYYDLQELDRPTLMRLIQKIEISEKYTVDDHEERDIHIYYNFVGYIEV